MRKALLKIVIAVILTASTSTAQDESLDELTKIAVDVSPKIQMLKAKRNAAINRIEINSNLPDPVLKLGLVNMPTNTFSFTQEPMTQKVVALTQSIPFPGSLGAIEEVNAVDTLIIDEEIYDAENEIRMMTKQKYYELSYLRKAIMLNEQSLNLLKTISDVVSMKYTVATASQQNVIKVQLQITNLMERLEELKSIELSFIAELNALLLRDPLSEISTIDFNEIEFLISSQINLDSLALINRPLLKGVKYAELKSQMSQTAAEKKFYPNFNLQLQYGFREKIAATNTNLNDFFSVMVGVTLPLNYGGKYSSAVEEQISMQEFYSNQYALVIQNLDGKFGSITSQLISIQERIQLFEEGLLPQAQQNFNSALASYQVDEVDFINVIDAQDQQLKIETNLYRLKIDYLKLVSELEFLTGSNLN